MTTLAHVLALLEGQEGESLSETLARRREIVHRWLDLAAKNPWQGEPPLGEGHGSS